MKVIGLANKFYKLAMLQVPSEVVDQIFNLMKPIYLGALAHKAKFIEDRKIRTSLLSQILAQGVVKPFSGEIATARLSYPVSAFAKIDVEKAKKIGLEEIKINAAICFMEQIRDAIKSTKWNGLYKEDLDRVEGRVGVLYVYRDIEKEIKKFIETNNKNFVAIRLAGIKDTIEHEAQHLVQNLIGLINIGYNDSDKLPRGGLSSGSDPYNWKNQSRGESKLPHDLRDVEFYPVLSGSIKRYKEQVKNIPDEIKDLYTRAWVSDLPYASFLLEAKRKLRDGGKIEEWDKLENSREVLAKEKFFKALKLEDFNKWKKAVSELFKSII